jgi:uncharacterized integral membrane protein
MTQEQPEAGREARVQRVQPAPAWRPSGRQVTAAVLLVVVLVFALANLEDASIDFVFDQVRTPVVFVIAVPALLGFLAGLIVQRHRDRRRPRS